MWHLRKFYGGKDGVLPPTDPRILAMTPYQMELDFEHMMIDEKLRKGGESYEDDSFDAYDKESEDTDSLLSEDMPTFTEEDSQKGQEEQPMNVETATSGEWEEVEIDNLEE